jgi:hypothetical protein
VTQKQVVDYASQGVVIDHTVSARTGRLPSTRPIAQEVTEMLFSTAALAGTTEPVDEPAPQPLPAAPSPVDAASTEVLITTQQVLFSTAAAAGVRRENTGGRFVAVLRRMFATSAEPERPRSRYYPKHYAFIENAAMARAMDRL